MEESAKIVETPSNTSARAMHRKPFNAKIRVRDNSTYGMPSSPIMPNGHIMVENSNVEDLMRLSLQSF